MKNNLYILIVLLYITILSCNIEQNITGEWKRIKGGSEGMIVNVIKEKDYFVGRVTKKSDKNDILEFYYVQKNSRTNETIIYSNSIISEDYGISSTFFDKKKDSVRLKNFTSKRTTEIYNNSKIDNSTFQNNLSPDVKIKKSGSCL